jgi:hypothetical protein
MLAVSPAERAEGGIGPDDVKPAYQTHILFALHEKTPDRPGALEISL